MLYHWSPVSKRKSIMRDGLCPHRISNKGNWRSPYTCFCRYPSTAWGLSANHNKIKRWDLWCCWTDAVGKYETINFGGKWWMTEYRVRSRIPKSKVWHVGTRVFKSARHS